MMQKLMQKRCKNFYYKVEMQKIFKNSNFDAKLKQRHKNDVTQQLLIQKLIKCLK
jgi:hypothetical protein